jgi:hypothetical protein
MRDHALTGTHAQQLRQGFIVRANNFFIDDAGQLHRNCNQRTYMRHLGAFFYAAWRVQAACSFSATVKSG